MDGDRGGYGCVGACLMHTCMHRHVHTYTRMLNMINMINMDASMSAAICNFYTCVCMHLHACVCMCMCVVTPPMP